MDATEPRVQVWFDRLNLWRDEAQRLRQILRSCGLVETFKWRGPCYMHAGGNVVFLGVFKDCVSLGFFKGSLLTDPSGLLVRPGENSRIARVYKARSLAAIDAGETELRAILAEAMALEAKGVKLERVAEDVALPQELAEALAGDPEFATAFSALTPGRRRGWALTIGQPKQSSTRVGRVAKARPLILMGKGIHDR